MEENNLLSKHQSGFKRKFSCETAVNYAVSRWKNAKNNKILAIFLDFKREHLKRLIGRFCCKNY